MPSYVLTHLRNALQDLKGRLDEELHTRFQARADRIQKADEHMAVGEAVHVLLEAYREAGYAHVQVQTAGDDAVCLCCRERQGRVYPIETAPRVLAEVCANARCRCLYVPLISDAG